MFNEKQIAAIEKVIKQYCLDHPKQFADAMKDYSFQSRRADHVDHTIKLS